MKKAKSRKLSSRLARREGGKSQVKIGDMREILSKFEILCAGEMARNTFKHYPGQHFAEETESRTLNAFKKRVYKRADKMLKAMRKAEGKK